MKYRSADLMDTVRRGRRIMASWALVMVASQVGYAATIMEGDLADQLDDAIYAGDARVVRKIVESGYPIDSEYRQTGHTPLAMAVLANKPEIVRLLCDLGSNVNQRDPQDQSPLYYAINDYTTSDVFRILLEKGANPRITASFRRSPLDMIGDGYPELTKILTEHERNGVDGLYTPLLHFAERKVTVSEVDPPADLVIVLSEPLFSPVEGSVTSDVEIAGQNLNGVRYQPKMPVKFTIPAGATTTVVSVKAMENEKRDPTQYARFRILCDDPRVVIRDVDPFIYEIVDGFIDEDKDRLPDYWERKYFGNLDAKPDEDLNQDGYTTEQEYLMGAHPRAGMVQDTNNVLKLEVSTPLLR